MDAHTCVEVNEAMHYVIGASCLHAIGCSLLLGHVEGVRRALSENLFQRLI
ncbi:hypothetical protein GCM10012278_33760 [Nonomuraea glycinis]|uniref:Uncharacterized protein n=1 Tax=Nonomuraea glycinis TaxID=2047744 RepID=A0A918E6K1_9ACTN|nr:hypothetical protein GCM10012278_33760 [Nonomuraea glycinis]